LPLVLPHVLPLVAAACLLAPHHVMAAHLVAASRGLLRTRLRAVTFAPGSSSGPSGSPLGPLFLRGVPAAPIRGENRSKPVWFWGERGRPLPTAQTRPTQETENDPPDLPLRTRAPRRRVGDRFRDHLGFGLGPPHRRRIPRRLRRRPRPRLGPAPHLRRRLRR